jgi:hypothetical protein
MRFFIFNATGAIQRWGDVPPEMVELQARVGEYVGIGDCTSDTHWVPFIADVPQAPVAYTPAERERLADRPRHSATWDTATRQWIDGRDLEQQRADAWARIKAARSAAEYGGFDCQIGGVTMRFDSDSENQRRLQGAVAMAQLAASAGQPFAVTWTLEDNSVVTLSAADLIAAGVALGNHVTACFDRGRTLREQIAAATTKAELDAIVW